MSPTWYSEEPATILPPKASEMPLVILRLCILALVLFGGLLTLLLLRLGERPFFGQARPVTSYLTQYVCRAALWIIGLRLVLSGTPMAGKGVAVANHASWLDIFVLNAGKRIFFMSKAEVASWPGIGWLARATGTLFIERNPAQARAQTGLFRERLDAGHKILFFPEGTSTDGLRVLPFKPALFEALFAPHLRDQIAVQPVSVRYHAPNGRDARFYGWWGGMDFGPHLLAILAPRRGGQVEVMYHDPLPVKEYADRKALARACQAVVSAGHGML